MVPGVNSQALCIALARNFTNSKPSSKEIHLLITSAENSPSECPATMSGFIKSSLIFPRIVE